ncbi:MAG: PAS domain-containing protein [Alphaproteobacteria bacterium]|nr:PAS domain-containing protein [Alphaproteobacteria bacterium]
MNTQLADDNGTIFEIIRLDEVDDPLLGEGIAYWRSLRGARAFPAREQIDPRALARLLSRTVLIKVLDGGHDFQYVIVGDEISRAYSTPLVRRRISDIVKDMPNTIGFWALVYRDVCREPRPCAVRLRGGHDGETRFSEGTVVLLPLGPSDDVVDHMITFGKRTLIRTEAGR